MNADPFALVAALTVLVAAPIALLAGLALRLIHQFTTARSSSGGRDAQRDPPGGATFNQETDR
jgi:hypothetical protein